MEGSDGDQVVLLLSGGVDSAVLLAELCAQGARVVAVTFDYGQRHSAEIAAATELAKHYRVVEHVVVRLDLRLGGSSALLADGPAVTEYGDVLPIGQVDTYVPMRNLTFLAHAAGIAQARAISRVLIGFNRDDAVNYWDCGTAFVERLNATLASCVGAPVRVEVPYVDLAKSDIVARAREYGVPLDRTLSCYAPVAGRPCGGCLACRILERAMHRT